MGRRGRPLLALGGGGGEIAGRRRMVRMRAKERIIVEDIVASEIGPCGLEIIAVRHHRT